MKNFNIFIGNYIYSKCLFINFAPSFFTVMKTTNLELKDFNEIKNLDQLDVKLVVGSIRMFFKRLLLKSDGEFIVNKFLNYKFKK